MDPITIGAIAAGAYLLLKPKTATTMPMGATAGNAAQSQTNSLLQQLLKGQQQQQASGSAASKGSGGGATGGGTGGGSGGGAAAKPTIPPVDPITGLPYAQSDAQAAATLAASGWTSADVAAVKDATGLSTSNIAALSEAGMTQQQMIDASAGLSNDTNLSESTSTASEQAQAAALWEAQQPSSADSFVASDPAYDPTGGGAFDPGYVDSSYVDPGYDTSYTDYSYSDW